MNKPVHLALSILELSKILMYVFWYDYVKPKYGEIVRLLYGYRQFHCIHKSINIMRKMLKLDLILQIIN